MIIWRLSKEEYTDLSGSGSFIYGGRWNSEGHNVVYCSSTLSLSCLEVIVSLPQLRIPKGFVSLKINIPSDIKIEEFKADLSQIKHIDYCRKIGDRWAHEMRSAILIVPSVIIPQESNILINAIHPEAIKTRLLEQSSFELDPRFLK